jgi:DNA-binding transcriptional regulator YiaG
LHGGLPFAIVVSEMHALLEEVLILRRLPKPPEARAIRLAAKVSRRRLAKELGVAEETVYRWEVGISRPRGKALVDYASVLTALQEVGA